MAASDHWHDSRNYFRRFIAFLMHEVGLTVSASIPVAVLSITIFRIASKFFRSRDATILQNNIVQTAGSAGDRSRSVWV